MIVSLRDIAVGYDKNVLIEQVSLDLQPGGLHFLIGCNGSGKSTLMRTIAGLQLPIGGEVLVDDLNVHSIPVQKRARVIAYQSSRQNIRSRITVIELLHIGAGYGIRGFRNKQEWNTQLASMCERTGINGLLNTDLTTLSDGEFQKVLITVILLRKCPVILLDEPLSHLDPPSQQEMLSLFEQLAEDHLVLISSHHLDIVARSAASVHAVSIQRKLVELMPSDLQNQGGLKDIFGDRM